MPSPKASSEVDTLVNEIQIAAPPERVFQALVDPRQVVQWWGQAGLYRATEFESDLRVGGKWRIAGPDGRGNTFEVVGEYLEVAPPHRLVHTWVASWTGSAKTTVRWELEGTGQGTRVRIIHSGLALYPELAKSYQGWPNILRWLQALLERGESIDNRQAGSAR